MRRRTMLATLGVVGTSGCLRFTDQGSGGDGTTATTQPTGGASTSRPTAEEAGGENTTGGGDTPAVTLSERWRTDRQVRYVWIDDGQFVTSGYDGVALATPDDGTTWGTDPHENGVPNAAPSEAFAATADRVIFGFNTSGGDSAEPGATFIAYDRSTGDERWRVGMPDDGVHTVAEGIAVVGDTVVVASAATGSADGQDPLVYGVDRETGERRWETGTPDLTTGFISGVVAYDGTVYVTQAFDGTYLLDPETGSVTDYRESTTVSVWGGTAHDGTLFTASGDEIAAYRLDDGATQWSVPDVGNSRPRPSVDDDLVVVGTRPGYVYAVESDTGTVRWTTRLDRAVRGVALSDTHVWVWAVGSTLAAYDRTNGALAYEASRNSDLADLGVVDGTLLVGGDPATAYRIE
jgi:outer membrane protein assembly factor BamB